MLAVRCAAVEFNFDSFVLGILLSGGGGGGIFAAGGVIDVVSSSATASLFFISSSCISCSLFFFTLVPLRHTSLNSAPHPLLTYACCSGEKC